MRPPASGPLLVNASPARRDELKDAADGEVPAAAPVDAARGGMDVEAGRPVGDGVDGAIDAPRGGVLPAEAAAAVAFSSVLVRCRVITLVDSAMVGRGEGREAVTWASSTGAAAAAATAAPPAAAKALAAFQEEAAPCDRILALAFRV